MIVLGWVTDWEYTIFAVNVFCAFIQSGANLGLHLLLWFVGTSCLNDQACLSIPTSHMIDAWSQKWVIVKLLGKRWISYFIWYLCHSLYIIQKEYTSWGARDELSQANSAPNWVRVAVGAELGKNWKILWKNWLLSTKGGRELPPSQKILTEYFLLQSFP